jgi:hypothetical protein
METPPGLYLVDLTKVLRDLPNHRGLLRIARYYDNGPTRMVVYEVLDENQNQQKDNKNRTGEIHASYPGRLAEKPIGTLYRVGY